MVYECEQCSCPLPAGVVACPKCGETFDEAVPHDAEVPARGWQPKLEPKASSFMDAQTVTKNPPLPRITNRQEDHPGPQHKEPASKDLFYAGNSASFQESTATKSKASSWTTWKIILAISFLPITFLWAICLAIVKIWKHPTWSVKTKAIVTGIVAAIVVGFPAMSYIQTIQHQEREHKAVIVAQAQQEATQRAEQQNQRAEQQRIASLQATPQGRAKMATERKKQQLAAAEQAHQQDIIAIQAVKKQVAQQAKADKSAAINTQQKIDDSSTESSGGVDLTYNQVTQYLSDDIAMEETTQIHGEALYGTNR